MSAEAYFRSTDSYAPGIRNTVVNIEDDTTTNLTITEHSEVLIVVTSGSGTIVLPSILASDPTGGGPTGCLQNTTSSFRFVISATLGGNPALEIKTDGQDFFIGGLSCVVDGSDESRFFSPGSDASLISLNGNSSGGIVGTYLEITSCKIDQYLVRGTNIASGVPVNPFSGGP